MSDEELLNLFTNAIVKLTNEPNAAASSVKAAVEREWKKRLDRARKGRYSPVTPQIGMLATLGYRVGKVNGEKGSVRRKILAHVIEGELPMVGSPAYTDEWGTPRSQERYRKLIHFFDGQLNNSANAEKPQAMIEWAEDREWVQQTYGHLAH
jgi:hypothetical protein